MVIWELSLKCLNLFILSRYCYTEIKEEKCQYQNMWTPGTKGLTGPAEAGGHAPKPFCTPPKKKKKKQKRHVLLRGYLIYDVFILLMFMFEHIE